MLGEVLEQMPDRLDISRDEQLIACVPPPSIASRPPATPALVAAASACASAAYLKVAERRSPRPSALEDLRLRPSASPIPCPAARPQIWRSWSRASSYRPFICASSR